MQNHEKNPEHFGEQEQADLDALLTKSLGIVMPERPEDMQHRLLQRISRSISEHAGLLTVRLQQGQWRNLGKKIRYKPLWQGPEGSSVLIEMAAGAALPTHRHHWLEEGIVLRGNLQIGDQDLTVFDYHVSPPGSRHEPVRTQQGVLAYLRGTSLGRGAWLELREFVGGLLPHPGAPSQTVVNDDAGWVELGPGVHKKDLWSNGVISSHFYRFDPGASFSGHPLGFNEECMMLSGEIFLGDILLQAGDYQLAPAGSRHGEAYSDTGALLFVRGAA